LRQGATLREEAVEVPGLLLLLLLLLLTTTPTMLLPILVPLLGLKLMSELQD